jgi:hypothetical protein
VDKTHPVKAARIDAPQIVSRDLVPIHRQCASVASIGKRYGLGSEETEPLPVVDVDKSVEKERAGPIVVDSFATKERAHETHNNHFGFSSRDQFLDGYCCGSGRRRKRRRWWRRSCRWWLQYRSCDRFPRYRNHRDG